MMTWLWLPVISAALYQAWRILTREREVFIARDGDTFKRLSLAGPDEPPHATGTRPKPASPPGVAGSSRYTSEA
jgi:hypothetical protein